jgi:hypothetical protein
VNTEVNTGAVVEAEITALLTRQVIEKKVAMTLEVMILDLEVILQGMIIILVTVLQEAVLHLQLIQDTLAKNDKIFETILEKKT